MTEAGTLVPVHLIRHGETSSYHSDSGLTDLGHAQASSKGVQLAGQLSPGAVVRLPHAPTARAAETARGLRDGLAKGLRDRGVMDVRVGEPHVNEHFDNFRLWCDGQALDPTQAYAPYRHLRDSGSRAGLPGWFAEMDRFATIQAAGDDPITYWLTQPVQHFEPAATAVRRFWTGIRALVRDAQPGLQVFVSTHSGCIRALAAAAFGHDPGEPANTEDAVVRLAPAAERAVVSYRGHEVELAVPTATTPP
ncbi:MAG TPA: histidine phosphatase family protein, partial [Trebonia sp.]|nr:histidine phosphatase family protein [Trebonia sp.]